MLIQRGDLIVRCKKLSTRTICYLAITVSCTKSVSHHITGIAKWAEFRITETGFFHRCVYILLLLATGVCPRVQSVSVMTFVNNHMTHCIVYSSAQYCLVIDWTSPWMTPKWDSCSQHCVIIKAETTSSVATVWLQSVDSALVLGRMH